ncbi:hypothetical protein N7G274_006151 [Stereocaulon virgatum]|uniref:Uncharacterized protein n=1 Tax=Stereocaulon virgatum TaxID=373712 RepID=A0ABR4A8G8_9LECA
MSSLKRSHQDLGSTIVEYGPPVVKRRPNQLIDPCLQLLRNDESEDDTPSRGTTSHWATASTGARTTLIVSSAGPSVPSKPSSTPTCTRPAGGGLDGIVEISLQRVVKLLDGWIKRFRTIEQPVYRLTSTKHPLALSLRFRTDATTVLLPTSEEIGILDTKTAAQLKRLKEIDTSVRFNTYLDHEEEQMSCGPQRKQSSSISPLQINLLGSEQYLNEVGSTLSAAGMYLQEPIFLDGEIPYKNTHFLTWDDMSTTPLLLTTDSPPNMDFATEIEGILHTSNDVIESEEFAQDARIGTALKRHQLSAA